MRASQRFLASGSTGGIARRLGSADKAGEKPPD